MNASGWALLPGDAAFSLCTSLTAVTFLGDAPKAYALVFNKANPTISDDNNNRGRRRAVGTTTAHDAKIIVVTLLVLVVVVMVLVLMCLFFVYMVSIHGDGVSTPI